MASIDVVTTSGAVLGAVLVKLRTAKGMKQADLAAAIGLAASTWSRIEKGESGLSIDQLRLVSKALGVKPGLILEMVEASEEEVEKHGVRVDQETSMATISAAVATGAVAGTVIPVFGAALGGLIGAAIADYLSKSKK